MGALVDAGNVRLKEAEAMVGGSVAPERMEEGHATARMARAAESSRGVRLPEHIAITEGIEASGKLNPHWVEWLMGYPTGHTDLNN